jgi:hypothetical protein
MIKYLVCLADAYYPELTPKLAFQDGWYREKSGTITPEFS